MLNIIKRIGKMGAECECTSCKAMYTTKDLYSSRKSKIGCLCNSCKTGIIDITEVTQEALRKWFKYDKTTGAWTHRFTTRSGVSNDAAAALHSAGYLTVRVGSVDYLAHRLCFLYMLGYLPEQVDHINHIRNDNRWVNLREVTNKINHQNESISSNNTTGVLGVAVHQPTNKYRAYIMVDKKQIHLGLFDTLEEAKLSRERANIKYSFHTNHGK